MDHESIKQDFGEFGPIDAVFRCPRFIGKVPENWLLSCELTIYLSPHGLARDATDADWRRAAFELSEQAIAIARKKYRLERAPDLQITGDMDIHGEIQYIRATLNVMFMEKTACQQ